jgi:four helix bundle protein
VRRKHHDLLAWQQSIALVKTVYRLTADFPREETYGLSSQMRRAAVSVPANIAEGIARNSRKELLQFLSIARGSLSELETYIVVAKDLRFARDTEEIENAVDRVFSLLGGLINSYRKARVS